MYSHHSNGKSTLGLELLSEYIRQGGVYCYIDSEGIERSVSQKLQEYMKQPYEKEDTPTDK